MQLGLFYESIRPSVVLSETTEEVWLTDAAAHGMDYLECNWNDIRSKPAEFFTMLSHLGIGLSIYVRCSDDGFLLSDRTQAVIDDIPQMVSLGIRDIMLIPEAVDGEDPKSTVVADKIVGFVTDFIRAAKPYGIQTTFEDYDSFDMPCGTCADMLAYAARIPDLGFTFDTGNFAFHGEDVSACYPLLCDRITHVHLKDRAEHTSTSNSAVTGQGVLPIKEILHLLHWQGYDGGLTAELFGVPPTKENLFASLSYVKSNFI